MLTTQEKATYLAMVNNKIKQMFQFLTGYDANFDDVAGHHLSDMTQQNFPANQACYLVRNVEAALGGYNNDGAQINDIDLVRGYYLKTWLYEEFGVRVLTGVDGDVQTYVQDWLTVNQAPDQEAYDLDRSTYIYTDNS